MLLLQTSILHDQHIARKNMLHSFIHFRRCVAKTFPGRQKKSNLLVFCVVTFVLLFQQKHTGLVLTQGTCVLSRRKGMAGGKSLQHFRNICESGSCVTLHTLRLNYKNKPAIGIEENNV